MKRRGTGSTYARLIRRKASRGPMGYGGGGYQGGPMFSDAFRSRRAPTPFELSEAYKQVIYACSMLNEGGVARTRLALYVGTTDGQAKPKCLTRPLSDNAKDMRRGRLGVYGKISETTLWFQKAMGHASSVDEVAEHVLLDAFDNVNDDWDFDSFIRFLVVSLDLFGHFYVWTESETSVQSKPIPTTIWPLLAQYVLPERSPNGSLTLKYNYFGQEYEPWELIRGRFTSARDPYGVGYGPTQAAYVYAGLTDQWTSLQQNLLTQGGQQNGFITDKDSKEMMGEAEARRYEVMLNAKLTPTNAGRIVYIPGNKTFFPTVAKPKDLAGLELDQRCMQGIANCFGVPLSLLKTEEVNLANATAGHRQHAELGIDPRCAKIGSALTKWTRRYGKEHGIPGWERLFWAFDNPVSEDAKLQADIHAIYLDRQALSRDEVRLDLNRPPMEGGMGAIPTIETTKTTLDRVISGENIKDQQAASADNRKAEQSNQEEEFEEDEETDKALALGVEHRLPFVAVGRGTSPKPSGSPRTRSWPAP